MSGVWTPKKGEIDKKNVATFFGVTTNVGSLMTLWCLLPSVYGIARSSVTPIAAGDLSETGIQ